jgi:hypothetical protein
MDYFFIILSSRSLILFRILRSIFFFENLCSAFCKLKLKMDELTKFWSGNMFIIIQLALIFFGSIRSKITGPNFFARVLAPFQVSSKYSFVENLCAQKHSHRFESCMRYIFIYDVIIAIDQIVLLLRVLGKSTQT